MSTSKATTTTLRSFIQGKYVVPSGSSSHCYDLVNAATGQARASVQVASSIELDAALDVAMEAQQRWNVDFSPLDRARLLNQAAHVLQDPSVQEQIAMAETLDTGRPIMETRHEAPGAADCLQWFAGLAPSVGGQHLCLAGGSFGYTRREPLGLTVGIGAWNYPLQSAVWKSAPALAFGNSMVFKPSELTPTTALKLAEIYQQVGIPDGVFNVVLGDGATVGKPLVQDTRPNKISFTGSMPTGKTIYRAAADDLKKVTLELGGKSPLILCHDANVEAAVSGAMMANWYSSGQVCSNGTRVFCHESIRDEFLERLVERTRPLRIGDPLDDATQIGPMVSQAHMDKVLKYIQHGIEVDQATLLYGGNRIMDRDGFYLEPAIFIDCTDDMKIVQEEIFGMVMTVLSFDDEDEVIQRANDTPFGLSAGVFTQDLQRAHRLVAQLEAGTTWINNYNLAPVELPWGGFKHSGLGSENGLAGVESWTRLKSVYVEMNTIETPYD
ncbi:NADP-dependent betaine aldehyde dehydrogenase [Seminavis robusta]|uniref:NADP-dependent betaine aldehyde dehydrogenase n=1 Tax=Seminavis robusta TaxID=568900 RepID=A0A9N8DC89_9STRA|nr:NADP-dependent betaine aldehyde dehydrogenase [Seminavis robusta]|eukprot:Sro32_g020590.1 NADP-dependent betaine aldehyde dehydrogenase (497) ;mRNA; r:7932-9422